MNTPKAADSKGISKFNMTYIGLMAILTLALVIGFLV